MSLKPTFYDFVLNDDHVVQVTRNYAGLYMLKAYDPELYEKSQIFNRKTAKNATADDLEMAAVIYAAYVTACLVNNGIRKSTGQPEEEIMSEIDFMAKMPTEGYKITNIFTKLFGDEKKRTASPKHFGKRPT